MKPLYFTVGENLRLMIIPDTLAHLDGHTIITHTYSVFRDNSAGNPLLARSKENTLHLEEINDPDYYGFIAVQGPGSLFTYTSDGQKELSPEEVSEVVERLNSIRDNPSLWNQAD